MTEPGDQIGEAVQLAADDCWESAPDATRITVVVVARIERDGRSSEYRLGGGPDTPVDDAERIVQMAAVSVGGLRAVRALRRPNGDGGN